MKKITVAIVVTEGFSTFHLSVPLTIFGNSLVESNLFSLHFCTENPGIIWSKENTAVMAEFDYIWLSKADVIILPYWNDITEKPPETLLHALQEARVAEKMIIGLCLGSFVLAWAGILDGHRAATHWEFEEIFQTLFPKVTLDINSLFIDDENLITSAGSAAAIDCCLHIVRAHFGKSLAERLARRMVVAPHRSGGQAQFIEQKVRYQTGDIQINHLLDYLLINLNKVHRIDELSDHCAMSRRTLTRRFVQATGVTIGQWILTERLRRSQEFLTSTDESIERVAELSGFKSTITFRQLFRQKLGVSPREWRNNFHENNENDLL